MIHRANGNHNMLNLVPKWLNIFMRNDNSGSLVHVTSGGDRSIYFVKLHHHATYFIKQQLKSSSSQLHEIRSKILEYGNKKSAKKTLDDAS